MTKYKGQKQLPDSNEVGDAAYNISDSDITMESSSSDLSPDLTVQSTSTVTSFNGNFQKESSDTITTSSVFSEYNVNTRGSKTSNHSSIEEESISSGSDYQLDGAIQCSASAKNTQSAAVNDNTYHLPKLQVVAMELQKIAVSSVGAIYTILF